jgi:superfamily II DNA helicase RecQ
MGLVPIGHAGASSAHDEERRLLYVASTRAERSFIVPGPRLAVPAAAGPGSSPRLDAVISEWILRRTCPPSHPAEQLVIERERLRRARRPPSFRGPPGQPEPDPAVVESLRLWRARAARASSVPASVLLHDRTLFALAAAEPATMEDLIAVPGIGGVKAARYGDALLAAVAVHRLPA